MLVAVAEPGRRRPVDLGGTDLQLALTEVPSATPSTAWSAGPAGSSPSATDDSVTLATTVWPTPGYPFLLAAVRDLPPGRRRADRVELRARNEGGRPAPYGVGQHPYLLTGADLARRHVMLTVPARTRLLADERGNPAGREDVDGTAYDFRTPAGSASWCWTPRSPTWSPDDDGRVRVRLDDPDGGGVELRAGPATRWLQAFTGDTLAARPAADRSARWSRCPARPAPSRPVPTWWRSSPARSTCLPGASAPGEASGATSERDSRHRAVDPDVDNLGRDVLALSLVGSCSASNDSNARAVPSARAFGAFRALTSSGPAEGTRDRRPGRRTVRHPNSFPRKGETSGTGNRQVVQR